jgi:hypothetical protein
MAGSFLEVFLGLVLVSAVAGWFVNVNRFSLHAMYRSRLVRAYLGASNLDRRPNPITGFDEEDERLSLASLRRVAGDRPACSDRERHAQPDRRRAPRLAGRRPSRSR